MNQSHGDVTPFLPFPLEVSDEEEVDHAAGVYFFSVDKEPGYASGP